MHAMKWGPHRNWCLAHGLKINELPEEKKHQGYIKAGMLLMQQEKKTTQERPWSNTKLREKIRNQLQNEPKLLLE